MAALFRNRRFLAAVITGLAVAGILIWTDPNIRPVGTVKIWDRNRHLIYESAGTVGSHIPVPYTQLPKTLIDAVVASEDETFWINPGIDPIAILRSVWLNIRARRVVSGASTITQQLARAAVLPPEGVPRVSLVRKLREALIALRLTAVYGKQEIITLYLNRMYFGNLAYGAEAASLTYFGKDVRDLSLPESAMLAGLLSSPEARDPFVSPDAARRNRDRVLSALKQRGYISEDDYTNAAGKPLALIHPDTGIKAPHFVQYVLETYRDMGLTGNHGINIHTSFEPAAYDLAQDIARYWVRELKDRHGLTNAALVAIRNDTGEIVAMLGGIDYYDATVSGQVNMATALRQPGSAMKPVTYAAAFNQGMTPASVLYDVRKTFLTRKGEGFAPNNYDGTFHGPVSARVALASSLNIPAVEILDRIGTDVFLNTAHALGISSLTDTDRYDLSLTLGGGEVTLLELTNVYAGFARGGTYLPAYAITDITDDRGTVLYRHPSTVPAPVFGDNSPQIAYLITDILSDPKARMIGFGEKNPLVLDRPAAVKTGTTTDWHDNWTVGYTPEYTVGVWVGNNDNRPMREITGVVGAAPIWHQFLEEYLKGQPAAPFPKPDGLVTREVCTIDGLLADGLCPETATETFVAGTQPAAVSHTYRNTAIDIRNGLLATADCPNVYTRDVLYPEWPPEAYSWARSSDQPVMPDAASPLCAGNGTVGADTDAFLTITNPRQRAVFESAPEIVANEAVVFEVNVSRNITQVIWYLDGKELAVSDLFPFNYSWKPRTGTHILDVIGITAEGDRIRSPDVTFRVVGYKSGY